MNRKLAPNQYVSGAKAGKNFGREVFDKMFIDIIFYYYSSTRMYTHPLMYFTYKSHGKL